MTLSFGKLLNDRKKGRSCDQIHYHAKNKACFQEPLVRCLICTWQLVFSSLRRSVQPPHTPTCSRETHKSSVSVPIEQLVALIDYAMKF